MIRLTTELTYRSRQNSYNDMDYSNTDAQASNPSLHGAPPPSYKSRHDDGEDHDPRQQRRQQQQRRPSESSRPDNNSRQRQRSRSGSQHPSRQQSGHRDDAPVPPSNSNSRRQPSGSSPYGSREDQNAYHEHNQSSVALDTSSRRQQSYGNFDQQPPSSTRNGRGKGSSAEQADMYEIPTLPKGSRQRQYSNDNQPQSPPYSARAPGSAGPSPGYNGAGGAHVTSNAPEIDMNAFFEELDSVRDQIKEMDKFITYLDQLHSRNLSGTGGDQVVEELQNASAEMRQMTNNLRMRVKDLQETTRIRTHGQAEQDRLVRKTQLEGLRNR